MHRIIPLLFLITPLLAASRPARTASSLTTWITQIVPLVIVGEGWSERIVLHNVDPKWTSTFNLTFYNKDGALFPVQISNSLSVTSRYTFTIDPGKTLVIDLPPILGEQKLGWAEIDQNSTSTVSGDASGLGDMFAR